MGLGPSLVQLVDVDLVVDVHELQQMEQEQRHVAVRDRGNVGDAAGPGDPRVELAEPQVAGRRIEQEIELEVAAVPLLPQAFPHRDRSLARDAPLLLGEQLGRDVVAAPAAVVGRELGEPGELGHQRPDQRAVTRDHALDRELARLDPPHHLDVVVDDLLRVRPPVALVRDEERRLPGVAVRGLHDEVLAEARGRRELQQRPVVGAATHRVRHARDAGLVAEPRGLDLRVHPVAERRRRERDVEPELGRELLGLLVEHQERRLTRAAVRGDEVADLLVAQQVVHDLLDRSERAGCLLLRDEDVRVRAVERVVVVHEPEVPHPPVDPQQVECGRAHEVDGRRVRPEEVADRRDAGERLRGDHRDQGRRTSRRPLGGSVRAGGPRPRDRGAGSRRPAHAPRR